MRRTHLTYPKAHSGLYSYQNCTAKAETVLNAQYYCVHLCFYYSFSLEHSTRHKNYQASDMPHILPWQLLSLFPLAEQWSQACSWPAELLSSSTKSSVICGREKQRDFSYLPSHSWWVCRGGKEKSNPHLQPKDTEKLMWWHQEPVKAAASLLILPSGSPRTILSFLT